VPSIFTWVLSSIAYAIRFQSMRISNFTITFEYKGEIFTGKVIPFSERKFKVQFRGYQIPINIIRTEEGWRGQWLGDQHLIDTIVENILRFKYSSE
jgi:hypothetical protein